jgi:hypothetical protein
MREEIEDEEEKEKEQGEFMYVCIYLCKYEFIYM